jgi:hypothetical protein
MKSLLVRCDDNTALKRNSHSVGDRACRYATAVCPASFSTKKGDYVFKNLMIYRLVSGWPSAAEPLEEALEKAHFVESSRVATPMGRWSKWWVANGCSS